MLIRMSIWKNIRDQFSEKEKAELNRVYTGETICPRGITINDKELTPELLLKLTTAMKEYC